MLEKSSVLKLIESYTKKENYDQESVVIDNMLVLNALFYIIIFFWAVIILMNKWKILPDWAKILALLSLFNDYIGGPIGTLIIVYILSASTSKV